MANLLNYSIELEIETFKELQKQIKQIDDYLLKTAGSNYTKNMELFRDTILKMANEDLSFILYLKN